MGFSNDVSGLTLNGRYQLVKLIGGGGMAQVYQARDLVLRRLVAVKILRDQYASDPKFVERFQREAEASAGLSHPNIVSIYDVGKENGLHYIVMDHIQGETLRDYVVRSAPLPTGVVVEIGAQIALALESAHRNGLIHRDIKPGNVMLTTDGSVKVVDFGIAKGTSYLSLTSTGVALGTVAYMSPEQIKGGQLGPHSDIYSLGVTLYEMATGKLPFESDSDVGMALKHISELPIPPHQVNRGVPAQLAAIIMRSLEKDPAQRFSSAIQMARALKNVLFKPAQPVIMPRGALSRNGLSARFFFLYWIMSVIAVFLVVWSLTQTSLFGKTLLVDYGDDWVTLAIFSAVLALLNTFIRRIQVVLSIPLIGLIFGLFIIVSNTAMFALAAWLVPSFSVAGFWGALMGALAISIFEVLLTVALRGISV